MKFLARVRSVEKLSSDRVSEAKVSAIDRRLLRLGVLDGLRKGTVLDDW